MNGTTKATGYRMLSMECAVHEGTDAVFDRGIAGRTRHGSDPTRDIDKRSPTRAFLKYCAILSNGISHLRWQRRWFVLYDDGELTYSLDEHVAITLLGKDESGKTV
ncbi:unnamed protein product [Leptidea sinapis]|uniref:PH domain-containing protein n=1 Tax=Leptidea sinapis TaxID=189913 RepID=A0A5E4PUB9_9NEOP|nr:unnamed protein product [Leptidea sinapis]